MGAGFRGRGGGGGVHHMSPEEAQAFFGQFFGGSGEVIFITFIYKGKIHEFTKF